VDLARDDIAQPSLLEHELVISFIPNTSNHVRPTYRRPSASRLVAQALEVAVLTAGQVALGKPVAEEYSRSGVLTC
jgi:hypothetical protein